MLELGAIIGGSVIIAVNIGWNIIALMNEHQGIRQLVDEGHVAVITDPNNGLIQHLAVNRRLYGYEGVDLAAADRAGQHLNHILSMHQQSGGAVHEAPPWRPH